jgi:phosphoglycerate dehydrogenase-like enzyme
VCLLNTDDNVYESFLSTISQYAAAGQRLQAPATHAWALKRDTLNAFEGATMPHVLVTAPFAAPLMDRLRAVSPDLTFEQMTLPDRTWPETLTTDAEILYAVGAVPAPNQAPNLRWIQAHWAGVDHMRSEPVWDSHVLITTASGIHAPNMAQYVMAQILGWAHRVPSWYEMLSEGSWPQQRWQKFVPAELRDATLGILGYGSIGREVARLAKAFGMHVLATKRELRKITDEGYAVAGTGDPEGSLPDRLYPPEATGSMAAECDFLVVTLPLTKETQGAISENILRGMKPSAFLVNVGRGEVVDQEALIKALKRGWIAGAGLDVFENEPLPDDSPLWQLENVVLTPHVSGFTPAYDRRAVDLFIANLTRYLNREPLLNLVNREIGY